MAVPRRFIVDESCSSIYHCVSRTVRQAFLLAPERDGEGDPEDPGGPADAGGRVDNHRRDWILDRIRFHSQIFAVDCISLAVMGNHLHLLLRILPEVVESWSASEVAHRWLLLRPQRALREATGVDLNLPPLDSEVQIVASNPERVARLRGRLSSLSWYMKELKEWTARRVNREEKRTGAFWEERFRSFRVLDAEGLLRCATYIDLNPVAACMVDEPLLARYTSVAEFARSTLGPQDVKNASRPAASLSTASAARSLGPPRPRMPDGGEPASPHAPPTGVSRFAARELWRRVLDAPHARRRHGAEPSMDGQTDMQLAAGMADFVASFDGMSFHPAVPARREPHHPRGVAEDDESIVAIAVLQPIEPAASEKMAPGTAEGEAGPAEEDPADATQPDSAQSDVTQSDAARSDVAQSDVALRDAAPPDAAQPDAARPWAADTGVSSTNAAPQASRSAPAAFRPTTPLRQARHRRKPPDVAVHEIRLGEYLTRLHLLADLAQERGIAKRQGRFRRRSREEIELALGREADAKGMMALLGAMFGSSDLVPGERMALLAELLGGARLFGTAVGSRAALAAEALRRGRSRVVMAFRPESRRRKSGATKDEATPAQEQGRPAVPRAG